MILAAILLYLAGAACMAYGLAWAARRDSDPELREPGVLPVVVALCGLVSLAWPVTALVMLGIAASLRLR